MGQLQEFQHSNQRGAKGKEKRQEIENLFEKIMKDNFPNLVKEIDMPVQEHREYQTTPSKTHHN